DTITTTSLEPGPHRRYQSAAALRDDVSRYLGGLAIEAKRGRRWYIARKFASHHRFPIAAGLALFAVLLGASIISFTLLRESRIETAKANSIRVFLEDTLGSVEPDSVGGDPSVGDVLDEAVHWIEIALADQPEVAASLHDTIGNSYRVLGRHADADAQLSAAMEIRRALFGEQHPEFAVSLNRIAMLRSDEGKHDEAESLAREALRVRERVYGDDSAPVVNVLMNLGSITRNAGRTADAVELYERALDIRRRTITDPSPDIAMCHFRLAEALAESDPEAALRHHERALETRRAALHPDHPDLTRSIAAVAMSRIEAGLPGSIGLSEELVSIRIASHGREHWRTARSMLGLARALAHEGRTDDALATAAEARSILVARLGPDHAHVHEADALIERVKPRSD
ncbi:MAG: tetratricopeptide repeat protein, partial [Phycisphaerales bacterium]|nr:tetratricopeptide repeat protein [Phycisphaerales bacterium]